MSLLVEKDLRALLEKARLGDRKALEQLLIAVEPIVYRFGMRMCGHSEDAEDVLQETLMALVRSVDDFRGDSTVSTWLFSVARSFCVKQRRKSKFAPKVEESLDGPDSTVGQRLEFTGPGPDGQVESKQTFAQVEQAIIELEAEQKEVLILRDIEGLSSKEVSDVLGITIAAVKSRLHRARSKLRELLVSIEEERRPGCLDIRSIFSQHLEGELSSEICSTMESHVAGCRRCETECKGLHETLRICRTNPSAYTGHGGQERVEKAIRLVLEKHL